MIKSALNGLIVIIAGLVFSGCGDLGGLVGTDTSSTLANTIAGSFCGTMQNPTSGTVSSYYINVAYVTDTSVQISPSSGSASATFMADLEERSDGNGMNLLVASDGLSVNGTYSDVSKAISYTIWLSSDGEDLEVFYGRKDSCI